MVRTDFLYLHAISLVLIFNTLVLILSGSQLLILVRLEHVRIDFIRNGHCLHKDGNRIGIYCTHLYSYDRKTVCTDNQF